MPDMPPVGSVDKMEPAWSRRYMDALGRYAELDVGRQETVEAVIAGLNDWARLIPQHSIREDGEPETANKWGLRAERIMLESLSSHLVAIEQHCLAGRIEAELVTLHQTAGKLDDCCVELQPGSRAEKRLVGTARMRVKALTNLLSKVKLENETPPPKRKKPGRPSMYNPIKDRQLMAEWASVKGIGGMCVKDFCERKGLSLNEFERAQGRVRKQDARAKANADPPPGRQLGAA